RPSTYLNAVPPPPAHSAALAPSRPPPPQLTAALSPPPGSLCSSPLPPAPHQLSGSAQACTPMVTPWDLHSPPHSAHAQSAPNEGAEGKTVVPWLFWSLKACASLCLQCFPQASLPGVLLDSSTVSRDVIQAVSCHLGPHLQSLCLRGSSLTETAFVHLLLACPRLSSLDLSGCNSLFMSGTLLSKPETISQARRALTNLQELNLAGLRYLSDLSFNRLTGCAPHLARLSLARCHLTFEFDPYRGNLRALDLSGTSITSPAMRALVQVEGLRLRELVLQNCSDLSNEAIGLLCTHQPHLTVLDLTGCSELSDRAALAVSAGLRALQSLGLGKLQRLTDGGFLGIAELRSLQRLDLSECSLVSGSELVKVCSTPELRPSLASLSFAFCSLLRVSSPIPAIGRGGRALPFSPIPLHLQPGHPALPHRGSLLHRALANRACLALLSAALWLLTHSLLLPRTALSSRWPGPSAPVCGY
uniref:Leucine rich repeat containing 29 n=1 Tax=Terrapene triunguis TaxID=2587831 RepID=A0A674ICQ9_9SAUR